MVTKACVTPIIGRHKRPSDAPHKPGLISVFSFGSPPVTTHFYPESCDINCYSTRISTSISTSFWLHFDFSVQKNRNWIWSIKIPLKLVQIRRKICTKKWRLRLRNPRLRLPALKRRPRLRTSRHPKRFRMRSTRPPQQRWTTTISKIAHKKFSTDCHLGNLRIDSNWLD